MPGVFSNTTLVMPGSITNTEIAAGAAIAQSKIVDAVNVDIAANAAIATTKLGVGAVVQVVNVQTGAVATGTTALPNDDTIPQITEGDQFLSLAITPTSATNKLYIIWIINISHSVDGGGVGSALFQDATAGALAAVLVEDNFQATQQAQSCQYMMIAGTTSSTTFRVRAGGPSGATTTMNGAASARKYGGVLSSSITITEIKA